MSEPHRTTSAEPVKPVKPSKLYPEFPLIAHAAGCWRKKIRGEICCLGPWDDPDETLNSFLAQKGDLFAGRKLGEGTEGPPVKDAAHASVNAKKSAPVSGELSLRT